MNPIIKQLSERKSIRQFTGEFVKDEDLELIIKTAQRCPTSINGQQIS
ncbi:MAG: NADPH-dependent oxidoreductase, partial [Aliarcobacter butzleri]